MNGNMDDDPFDDSHRPSNETVRQQPIPLAAPKPGYASPVSALNLQRPSPAASPEGRQLSPQMSHVPKPLTLVTNMNGGLASPSANGVPNSPHPLPPTMTPIKPVFALPGKAEDDRDVRFAATTPILRGQKEETLLPRRGERGDDFWRRFSMVVHQESGKRPTEKTRSVKRLDGVLLRLTGPVALGCAKHRTAALIYRAGCGSSACCCFAYVFLVSTNAPASKF